MMDEDIKEKIGERRTHDLTALGQTLMPFARHVLGARGFVGADILLHWAEIVGGDLAAFSVPQKVDFKKGEKVNGLLVVEVPSGAFALELQHKEKMIVQKANAFFGYAAVGRLKVVQNSSLEVVEPKQYTCERMEKTLVTPEEENYIRELSEDVQNPALREVLVNLGCQVLGQTKSEKNKNEI